MRLVGGRVQLGRSFELRYGGGIVILQLERESKIVVELEVIWIGLQAGAENVDGFVDFVHLQVCRTQILMRGRIGWSLLEYAPKKRNCIRGVSGEKKSQSKACARFGIFWLGLNDLAQ